MKFPYLLLLCAGLLGTSDAFAQQVSAADATQIAARFRLSNSKMAKSAADASQYSVAYTAAEGNSACFYVINSPAQQGYTIVSADSRLPEVLGYSDRGTFDANQLPCNFRWWLDEYKHQIAYFLDHQHEPAIRQAPARIPQHAPVKPLLTTLWDQGEPYNNLCPIDPSTNQRSVTGCVATAMAQVMKFHNWPQKATGEFNGFSFEGTTFDWASMLDNYTAGNYTDAQANAVATLMLNCGRSVDMDYGSNESGAVSRNVGPALMNYFGYDSSMHYNLRDYFTQAEWDLMVYNDLAKGHPVFYHGRTPTGGHAFVCDGYAGNGYYHFNWGWGGSQDGYFRLFALNPASGGIGSYAGGYNSSQGCFTSVIPASANELPKQHFIAMSGALTGNMNDATSLKLTFIRADKTEGMLYNPTVTSQSFTLHCNLVSLSNPTDTITLISSTTNDLRPNYGWKSRTFGLPSNTKDGEYELLLTFTPQGGKDAVVVRAPTGLSNRLKCTVANGKYTISEWPVDAPYSLILNGVTSTDGKFYVNGPSAMRVTLSNVGETDFRGAVTLSLTPATTRAAALYSVNADMSVPAGFSSIFDFSEIAESEPGEYLLSAHLPDGTELIGSPMRLQLEESPIAQIATKPQVEAVNIMPAMLAENSRVDVSCKIKPTDAYQTEQSGSMRIRLISATTGRTWTWSLSSVRKYGNSAVGYSAALGLGSIPTGQYYWQFSLISNGKETVISRRYPFTYYKNLTVEADDNTMEYALLPDNYTLEQPRYNVYHGTMQVPAKVDNADVKRLAPDAFTFAEQLESLELPASIAEIGAGQFYCAKSLTALTIDRNTPPALSDIAFGPGAIDRIQLSVPDSMANIYKRTAGWDAFNFGKWEISLTDGVKIIDGLATDGKTWYNPYYVSPTERPMLNFTAPDGQQVFYTLVVGDDTTEGSGNSLQLPALNGLTGKLMLSLDSAVQGIENMIDGINDKVDVYTTTGVLIMRGADRQALSRLKPGLYIAGGKKVVVK